MKRKGFLFCILLIEAVIFTASILSASGVLKDTPAVKALASETPEQMSGTGGRFEEIKTAPGEDDGIARILDTYENLIPAQWGEAVTGVRTRLDTDEKVVALTFDACGGKGGSGCDTELIGYLVQESVPATLFINARWIDENEDVFMALTQNSLFEIENHGAEHRPLSVTGRSAYGIDGTQNVRAVIDEVRSCGDKIYKLTGRRPGYFRSGTNYYDEIAVSVVKELGAEAVGYSLLGDAGATYSAAQIKKACLNAKPGSIIIFHMNHPEKETAEGIREAVPALRAKGFRFVRLGDYPLK